MPPKRKSSTGSKAGSKAKDKAPRVSTRASRQPPPLVVAPPVGPLVVAPPVGAPEDVPGNSDAAGNSGEGLNGDGGQIDYILRMVEESQRLAEESHQRIDSLLQAEKDKEARLGARFDELFAILRSQPGSTPSPGEGAHWEDLRLAEKSATAQSRLARADGEVDPVSKLLAAGGQRPGEEDRMEELVCDHKASVGTVLSEMGLGALRPALSSLMIDDQDFAFAWNVPLELIAELGETFKVPAPVVSAWRTWSICASKYKHSRSLSGEMGVLHRVGAVASSSSSVSSLSSSMPLGHSDPDGLSRPWGVADGGLQRVSFQHNGNRTSFAHSGGGGSGGGSFLDHRSQSRRPYEVVQQPSPAVGGGFFRQDGYNSRGDAGPGSVYQPFAYRRGGVIPTDVPRVLDPVHDLQSNKELSAQLSVATYRQKNTKAVESSLHATSSDLSKVTCKDFLLRVMFMNWEPQGLSAQENLSQLDTQLPELANLLRDETRNAKMGITFALNKYILSYTVRGRLSQLRLEFFVSAEHADRRRELEGLVAGVTEKFLDKATVPEVSWSRVVFIAAMTNHVAWIRLYYGDPLADVLGLLQAALTQSLDIDGLFKLAVPTAVKCWNDSLAEVQLRGDMALSRLLELLARGPFDGDGNSPEVIKVHFKRIFTTALPDGSSPIAHPFRAADPSLEDSSFQQLKTQSIALLHDGLVDDYATRQGVQLSSADSEAVAKVVPASRSQPSQFDSVRQSKQSYGRFDRVRQSKQSFQPALHLLTREEREVVRRLSLPPICFDFNTLSGCSRYNCRFPHTPLPKSALKYPLDVFLIASGGGPKGGKLFSTVEERSAEINRIRASVSSSTKASGASAGPIVPSALQHLVSSSHPEEQGLVGVLSAEAARVQGATLQIPIGPLPLRLSGGDSSLSPQEKLTEVLLARLSVAYPVLRSCSDDLLSGFMGAVFHAHRTQPRLSDADLYAVGVLALSRSIKAGAREMAARLSVPPRTAGAVIGPQDVLGTVQSCKPNGSPLFRLGPCQHPPPSGLGEGVFFLGSSSFGVTDLGEVVRYPDGRCLNKQCVILCLSAVVGVPPEVLSAALCKEAVEVAASIPDGSLNPAQLEAWQLSHDFSHLENGNLDIHLVRYFGAAFFAPVRLIVILADDTGLATEVQVLQATTWGSRPGDGTYVLLMSQGHARVVSRVPPHLGGDLRDRSKGAKTLVRSMLRPAADALLTQFTKWGLCPSICHHLALEDYNLSSTFGGICDSVMKSDLTPCPTCGVPTGRPLRRAGQSLQSSPLSLSGSEASGGGFRQPRRDLVPAPLSSWAVQVEAVGGLTVQTMAELFATRSTLEKQFACMSDEELKAYPFPPRAVQLAKAIRSLKSSKWASIDREAVQAKDAKAVTSLVQLALLVRSMGDDLVLMLGSVLLAMAVVRQGSLLSNDGLPVDLTRLQAFKELLSPDLFSVLEGMARFGVPLCVLSSPDGVSTPKTAPFASALLAKEDILYGTIKDVLSGNALLFSDKAISDLEPLRYHPTGAVLKSNGRDHRPISDLRELNQIIKDSIPERHSRIYLNEPMAVCPYIADFARMVIYQALMNPGVGVLISIVDIDNAFKRVNVNVGDSTSLATALPPVMDFTDSTAVFQVLLFGATHSPGWFGVLAWAMVAAWKRMGPARPHLNGVRPFTGEIHVDDLVSTSPDIGNLPHMACSAFCEVAEGMAGPGAVNVPKLEKDGKPKSKAKVWGYDADLSALAEEGLDSCTIGIPKDKVQKLLNLLSLDFMKKVRLRKISAKEHAVVQGLSVFFSRVTPMLKVIIAALYQMCASRDADWLSPFGDQDEVDRLWLEYEEALVLLRLLLDDAKNFQSSFVSSVVNALTPVERVQLNVPRIYLQSDATGGSVPVMAIVDFQAGEWAAQSIEGVVRTLLDLYRVGGDESRVAWAELLPVVAMAMRNGAKWRGLLVMAMVDNMEACAAINKRALRDPVMRYLQSLIVRLELRHGFEMWAPYINTHNNVLADDISRKWLDLGRVEMQKHVDSLHAGLKFVTLETDLQALVQQCLSSKRAGQVTSFAFPGEKGLDSFALRPSVARPPVVDRSIPVDISFPPVLEILAGLGQFAVASQVVGCNQVALSESHSKVEDVAKARLEVRGPSSDWTSFKEGILVVSTFYLKDRSLSSVLTEVRAAMTTTRPAIVIWVFKPSWESRLAELNLIKETMARVGMIPVPTWKADPGVDGEMVDAGDLFSPVLGRRYVLHFEMGHMASALGSLSECRSSGHKSSTMAPHLLPLDQIPEEAWVDGTLSSSTPKMSSGGRFKVEVCLRVQWRSKVNRYPVQSIHGPAATPVPWADAPSRGGGLLIWDDRGRLPRARSLLDHEVGGLLGLSSACVSSIQGEGLRASYWIGDATPPAIAESVMARAVQRFQSFDSLRPNQNRRASGGQRVDRGMGIDPGQNYGNAIATLLGNSIQQSTKGTYSQAFKHWIEWRLVRRQPLWAGEAGEAVESEILQFVAHRGVVMGYAHNTIHVMLNAVRHEHMLAGKANPLADCPLVAMAMKGLKLMQGGVQRKVPATIDLLRRAVAAMDLSIWDNLVTATSMVFMFLFMTRSREVVRKGPQPDDRQCLRNHMLSFHAQGKHVVGKDILLADEVVWMASYSKVDQRGQGTVRNVYAVPGEDLCLLSLFKRMFTLNPTCFARGSDFVFRCSNGLVVDRSKIVSCLRRVASELGIPDKVLSVISLRSGGASAMWDAKFTVDEIKMRGRWASDSFKRYVWEGRERARNIAGEMFKSKFSLMASLAYYERHSGV